MLIQRNDGTPIAVPSPEDTILPTVVAATTVPLAIALITFGLRIYSRIRPYQNLGWDDLTITIAVILTIANWAVNIAIYSITEGRHNMYVTIPQIIKAAKLGFLIMFLWYWSVTFIKISVALMLLRIKQTMKWKVGIWSLITVLVLVAIGATLTQTLQCKPIKANWEIMLRIQEGNCWDTTTLEIVTYAVSAVFAATDVLCALLPLAFIRKINRPLREKVVLAGLMGLGLLAAACGFVKLVIFKDTLNSSDSLYKGAITGIWTYSEQYIGIVAANLPCLKSLMEKLFKFLGGNITSLTSGKKPHYQYGRRGNSYYIQQDSEQASYHTSLRHGSRAEKEAYPASDENILLTEASGFRTERPREEKGIGIVKEVQVSWRESSR